MRLQRRRIYYPELSTYTTLVAAVRALPAAFAQVPCMSPAVDPDLWFSLDERGERRAKTLCASCPVAPECLRHAMAHHEIGIWGGTTQRERNKVMADRRSIGPC